MASRRRAVTIAAVLKGRHTLRHAHEMVEEEDAYQVLSVEDPSATARKTEVR
jgi:hypothetical protein